MHPQRHRHPGPVLGLVAEALEGGQQAEVVEERRPESPGDLAHLGHRRLGGRAQLGQGGRQGPG